MYLDHYVQFLQLIKYMSAYECVQECSPPDFRADGRRPSLVKCYEYVYDMKTRTGEIDYDLHEGRSKSEARTRSAKAGEYAHMATLGTLQVNPYNWVFQCSASLISSKFLLTAAHCIEEKNPTTVRFVGDTETSSEAYIHVQIQSSIVHPNFDIKSRDHHDIALVKMSSPFREFSKLIHPACLWSDDNFQYLHEPLGPEVDVTSWDTKDTITEPILQVADVTLIDSRWCKIHKSDIQGGHFSQIWDTQICARNLDKGVDTCVGEFGGPLSIKLPFTGSESIHFILGIGSAELDVGCSDYSNSHDPAVFTKVSSYIDWIERIVWTEL